MSLITENNQQYYAGSQSFLSAAGSGQTFTTTFDTDLIYGSYDPLNVNYALNNFKLYKAEPGQLNYTEITGEWVVTGNNDIYITGNLVENTSIIVQLKTETGGNYGNKDAYGNTVQDNWGSYAYTKLNDVINNFIVAYVGAGKLIPSVKRTDVIFQLKELCKSLAMIH